MIPHDLFMKMARPKHEGGVNPGRDLLTDPELLSRACDHADMAHNMLLLYTFVVGPNAKRVLEIGCNDGTSTLALLQGAFEIDGHVTSIDISDVPVAEALVDKFDMRSRWTFIRGDSHEVMPKLRAEKRQFDLIFVDGDHTYKGAHADVLDAVAMLKWDGVLFFHDSNMMNSDNGPGCGIVSYDLLRDPNWHGFLFPFGSDLAVFQRRTAGVRRLAHNLRLQVPETAAYADRAPEPKEELIP
jgi:SAM-dependent methyltransferase